QSLRMVTLALALLASTPLHARNEPLRADSSQRATKSTTVVRYIAAAATALQINNGREVTGAVYIYDRDSLSLIAQVPISDLAGAYNPGTAIVSPDGRTLYVAVKRARNAIAVVDVPSATLKTMIPIPAESSSIVWAHGAGDVS